MLSYVLPVEDKPPPPPIVNKNHLQLELGIQKQLQQQQQQMSPQNGAVNGLSSQEGMAPTTIQNFMNIEQSHGGLLNGGGGESGNKKIIKTHGKVTYTGPAISTESSASSLSSKASDVTSGASQGGGGTTPTNVDKLKPKLVQNGGTKTASLKRVSFGSSKGSMVETLIYESPLQEESEVTTPTIEVSSTFPVEGDSSGSDSKKVRVTFFESERPLVVHSPEPGDIIFDILDAPNTMTSISPTGIHTPQYQRQASGGIKENNNLNFVVRGELWFKRDDELVVLRQDARMATSHGGILYYVVKVPKDEESARTDSGWDNPFRPDGDLSREADEIVGLIKEGKPITSTLGNGTLKSSIDELDTVVSVQAKQQLSASPQKGSNGKASNCEKTGVVEVQRTIVSPTSGGEVEPVVIKKKSKCKCCVIQ